jgi:hypothetical protein
METTGELLPGIYLYKIAYVLFIQHWYLNILVLRLGQQIQSEPFMRLDVPYLVDKYLTKNEEQ